MVKKFEWNIYLTEDEKYIQIDLNGGCNSLIPLEYPETLEKNKAEKKAEIEQWAGINPTVVHGMELLE